jgi:hypothetical protein
LNAEQREKGKKKQATPLLTEARRGLVSYGVLGRERVRWREVVGAKRGEGRRLKRSKHEKLKTISKPQKLGGHKEQIPNG